MNQPQTYKKEVREQYETLPYPPRDPDMEPKLMPITWTDRMDYVNYRFFGGAHTFANFRVLIAGDGTGDASIYLAEQLCDTNAEIIALDLSESSQAIAKERAKRRKLPNIRHVHASLLDLPKLGLGEFDFISSGGVLHHLEDPDAGLAALKSVLKPTGVISIMVYGQIGRTGVYHTQQLLRMIVPDDAPIHKKVELARKYLQNVPKTNWFCHNSGDFIHDIQAYGDSGIYDLFLHSQDRGYTVGDVYDWVEGAGLHLAEFCPMGTGENYVYNPIYHMRDTDISEQFNKLSKREQQEACELMLGNIKRHFFFATPSAQHHTARSEDLDTIPFFTSTAPVHETGLAAALAGLEEAQIGHYARYEEVKHQARCVFVKNEYTAALLQSIDNSRTIGEIIDQVMREYNLADSDDTRQMLHQQMIRLFTDWMGGGLMALRTAQGKKFLSAKNIRDRAYKRCGLVPQQPALATGT